ncbi:MAG: CHAP domain-containing protein [Clostridiales bacterium]|nr:CHAP domain-containing protein [Clostridiales bacterium]
MKKSLLKKLRSGLVIALALAMGVAFMPVNANSAYAASFSTANAVSGLTVSSTDSSSVSLKWNAYAGASGYQIYRTPDKSKGFTYGATVTSTSCTRAGLPPGHSYYYKVRAYYKDSKGKVTYSKFSSIVTGTTKAFNTSSAVSGLKVASTDASSVTLQWNTYSGASGYEVYRTPNQSKGFTYGATVKGTSCKRAGLPSGKTYYYKVRAYYKDAQGKTTYSKFSSIVTGTTRVFNTGSAVSGLLVASYNKSSVTLKWNGYDLASGYEVYKASSKNGTYKKVKSLAKNTGKITGLKNKQTSYYKVRAYFKNASGTYSYSKYSSVIAATPIKFTEGKIGGYKVSGKTYDSVSFVWNSYPEAAGYQIYRAYSKNGSYKKIKSVTKTSFKKSGLTTNKTCYYKVRAYKKSGSKTIYTKFTSAVAGTPALSTPAVSVVSSKTGISVKWNAVSGASGYEVYRSPSKGGSYNKVKTTTGTTFSNESVTINKEYYYKVRAYRTIDGNKKYGSFSGPQLGVKASISKVSGVSAASKDSYVGLTWTGVSGASGYEVYRATGSSSNYTNVGNASKNSFNDYNVANGLTYYYKIRAYKNINGVKVYGDFSSVGYSRSAVVSTAVAWLGCKESNKSNKPIVDLYNANMGTKFSYTTAWCAIFVSAVAIKSGTTSIIVRGSYCPSVINVYKNSKVSNYKYGAGASYVPKAGDVIFFDWNRNGVPDHTGLVASVSGTTIKTIEGNYSDAVGYRTFSVGYKYVQGYGLPNYDDANGIVYTGRTNTSVGCGELAAMGIGTEPEGLEELGNEYEFVEQSVDENLSEDENVSAYDKMVYMVSKVRASAETEGIDCAETQYYAAFIYKLCQEEGLDASIMTVEDENGVTHAWVEVCLDDQWYTVDASKETEQIVEFVPESTDTEGAVAELAPDEIMDDEATDDEATADEAADEAGTEAEVTE